MCRIALKSRTVDRASLRIDENLCFDRARIDEMYALKENLILFLINIENIFATIPHYDV